MEYIFLQVNMSECNENDILQIVRNAKNNCNSRED